MDESKDGGAAFARAGDHYTEADGTEIHIFAKDGMSLRDWFAGQALAGLMANDRVSSRDSVIAGNAYDLADAMLVGRAQDE